jgi:hypothetical protein
MVGERTRPSHYLAVFGTELRANARVAYRVRTEPLDAELLLLVVMVSIRPLSLDSRCIASHDLDN